jgi:hypothetical protein
VLSVCSWLRCYYESAYKIPFFVPCRRGSAATTRYTSPMTTHITPLPTPEKLWGSFIEHKKRLNHFPSTETTLWQMQWSHPSPYATATPAAQIETFHRLLWSELSVALAHVNVVCVVMLLRSVVAYFTSPPSTPPTFFHAYRSGLIWHGL